jgi:lipopolysaccharide assembly protein A
MRLLTWLIRGFLLFTLFAFALNNQQVASVHWFFGAQWRAPMVMIVLAAFALGCALGVVAMLPGWWRRRLAARQGQQPAASAPEATTPNLAAGGGLAGSPVLASPSAASSKVDAPPGRAEARP